MNRKTFAWCLVAGLTAAAAWAQTADEIIEKHLQARGGKDKLKALQTARITGKMTMGQGMEAPFTLELARPNKLRMEFTFQGMTGVQAFDGTTGWMVMPFLGKTEPEVMPAEDAKRFEDQQEIDDLFLDYKDRGRQVEFAGKEDLEGTPVYKLKVTQKSGDVSYSFIDAETYLELKRTGRTKMRGQEVESETIFGDFKTVEGVVYSHSMEQKATGMPGGMVMTVEKIEVNPSVVEARFALPAVEKKEPPAPPKP